MLSDPTVPGRKRVILDQIVRAIRSTEAGEFIRVATWNYDDEAIANALLEAFKRGVKVQVVVSSLVYSIHWNRTYATLNAKGGDASFARRCSGGCRSKSVVHSKFVLISKAGNSSNVSMVGSFNLTKNTANKQWNDMVISRHKGLYDALVKAFAEYAADKPLRQPYRVVNMGKVKLTLWPSVGHRTILEELKKVRCQIPRSHWVNGQRRTRIRIAIAGWFDSYGAVIARRVRALWNSGCDIKIITGSTGQGVNRALFARGGRGPVPVRVLTVDRDRNGRAERYLHMKSFAVRGVFNGKPNADVLVTGSPNWSSRAQRSDEILVRYLGVPVMVSKYFKHINRLFAGRWAHR